MNMVTLTWVILALPILIIVGAFFAELPRRIAIISIGGSVVATILAAVQFGYRYLHPGLASSQLDLSYFTFPITTGGKFAGYAANYDLEIGVKLSFLSIGLAIAASASVSLIGWLAYGYLKNTWGVHRLYLGIAVVLEGLLGSAYSANLFTSFVAWLLVGFGCWMVAHQVWHTEAARKGHLRLLYSETASGALFACGLIIAFVAVGGYVSGTSSTPTAISTVNMLDFSNLTHAWHAVVTGLVPHQRVRELTLLAWFFGLAIVLRTGAFPFCLPGADATEFATPLTALIIGSRMTAAAILLWRLEPLFAAAPHALPVLGAAFALGALLAGVLAIASFQILRSWAWVMIGTGLLSLVAAAMGDIVASVAGIATMLAGGTLAFLVLTHVTETFESLSTGDIRSLRTVMPFAGLCLWCAAAAALGLGGWTLPLFASLIHHEFLADHVKLSALSAWVLGIVTALSAVLIAGRAVSLAAVAWTGKIPERRGFDLKRLVDLHRSERAIAFAGVCVLVVTALPAYPGIYSYLTRHLHLNLLDRTASVPETAGVLAILVGLAAIAVGVTVARAPVSRAAGFRAFVAKYLEGDSSVFSRASLMLEGLAPRWGRLVVAIDDRAISGAVDEEGRGIRTVLTAAGDWLARQKAVATTGTAAFVVLLVVGIVAAVWGKA